MRDFSQCEWTRMVTKHLCTLAIYAISMTSSWPCLWHGSLACSLPLPTALASNLLGAPPPNPWLIIGVKLIVELGWQRLSEADKNT